jgi:hypothetical protein
VDAHCQAEAEAAGLPGTYRALLATTNQSAASRFDLDGPNWVRPDGIALAASPKDLMDGRSVAAFNVAADGQYISDRVWAGARSPHDPGADGTCVDWTQNGNGTDLLGDTDDASTAALLFSDGTGASCNQTRSIYCLQE